MRGFKTILGYESRIGIHVGFNKKVVGEIDEYVNNGNAMEVVSQGQRTISRLSDIRGRLQFWLGILSSAVFLYLAIRNIPLPDLITSLADVDLAWLAIAFAFQVFALITRALRWTFILELEGSFTEAFHSQNIGYLFNNIFPFRIGELARIITLSNRCGISFVRVATSVVLERFLDVITVVLGLLFVLPRLRIPVQFIPISTTLAWFVLIAFVAFVLFVRYSHIVDRFIHRFLLRTRSGARERILKLWSQVVEGVKIFSNTKNSLRLSGWFLFSWLLSVFMFWCTMRAFVPDPTLIEAIFTVGILTLSLIVPSSPGYLGVFQFVGQQSLVIPFGSKYSQVTAFAIALVFHLIFYGTTSILGIIGIGRLSTSITNIRKKIPDK